MASTMSRHLCLHKPASGRRWHESQSVHRRLSLSTVGCMDNSRRRSPVSASLNGDDAAPPVKALHLNGSLTNGAHYQPPPEILHRPLTSTNVSNSGNGPKLRVAYQGVPGAHSEAAAAKAYPNCEAVPCQLFETAFEAAESRKVDRAVLPIENSLGGSIHRNYDLLLRHNLHIVGEVQHAVRHCLLALPGINFDDVKHVLSHPQALAQCEHTITKLLSKEGLIRESVDDTAGAAQYISMNSMRDAAAIASSRAAELYGLNILAPDIQDDEDNVTRFLMLAREPIMPRTDKPFKTSIVFSLEEGPGVLFKALAVFAMRSINLTKIESRPSKKRPLRICDDGNGVPSKYFDYLFYVDFEASMADPNARNALNHLKEFATFLRVLGSYPIDPNQA
ncbi:hypothetical protein LUZ60_013031 [Juncus effusus]|nr:hypothetical protein LUZ60_013031 [Juncus effusus]